MNETTLGLDTKRMINDNISIYFFEWHFKAMEMEFILLTNESLEIEGMYKEQLLVSDVVTFFFSWKVAYIFSNFLSVTRNTKFFSFFIFLAEVIKLTIRLAENLLWMLTIKCEGWRHHCSLIFLILQLTKPNIEVSGWLYQTKTKHISLTLFINLFQECRLHPSHSMEWRISTNKIS